MTESAEVESEQRWQREAEAAIRDISKHVRSAAVCGGGGGRGGAGCTLDLTTLEGGRYRVQVSAAGWQVLGDPAAPAYETVYALLNTISQKYRDSFGGELMNKLLVLAKQTEG